MYTHQLTDNIVNVNNLNIGETDTEIGSFYYYFQMGFYKSSPASIFCIYFYILYIVTIDSWSSFFFFLVIFSAKTAALWKILCIEQYWLNFFVVTFAVFVYYAFVCR